MNSRRGFTLIELLIVIAIILILIAIAVPNFLSARLRAKVTQTAADMKTVDMAIHMCANDFGGVDRPNWLCTNQNIYLSAAWDCGDIGNVPAIGIYSGWVMIHYGDIAPPVTYMGHILTSPIPYIESCPVDFFNTAMESNPPHPTFGFPASFHIGIFLSGALAGQGQPWEDWWFLHMQQAHPEIRPNFLFSLTSAGPDVRWSSVVGEYFYSPTNGTKTGGDIWRFSNGVTAP